MDKNRCFFRDKRPLAVQFPPLKLLSSEKKIFFGMSYLLLPTSRMNPFGHIEPSALVTFFRAGGLDFI